MPESLLSVLLAGVSVMPRLPLLYKLFFSLLSLSRGRPSYIDVSDNLLDVLTVIEFFFLPVLFVLRCLEQNRCCLLELIESC